MFDNLTDGQYFFFGIVIIIAVICFIYCVVGSFFDKNDRWR